MPDQIAFDGACAPNPGGEMRLGAVLTIDAMVVPVQETIPAAPGNTVNVAEYAALRLGLEAYAATRRTGPVLVQGDSQLIIRQMTGEYAVRGALIDCYEAAWAVIDQANISASFVWVPREQNTAADLLTQPVWGRMPPPDQRTYLVHRSVVPLPDQAPAVGRLNQHPSPGFGDFARLRVGGNDQFSGWRLTELAPAAGQAIVAQVRTAIPDQRGQAAVLRWCMRGLAVELAIRKQQVDAEIQANTGRRRAG